MSVSKTNQSKKDLHSVFRSIDLFECLVGSPVDPYVHMQLGYFCQCQPPVVLNISKLSLLGDAGMPEQGARSSGLGSGLSCLERYSQLLCYIVLSFSSNLSLFFLDE